MEIKTNLSNPANYGGKRDTSNIKYLVIHYTANDGDSDEANGNYFHNNVVKASAHYFVDDNSVTQSVPDDYVAWAVGGSKYANTKGGTFYGKCTNSNSISIELCDNIRNGKYDFTPNTLENAAELAKLIMVKYNIPITRVIRHYDVTGKICPKPFVDDVKAWNEFKQSLVGWHWDGTGWCYEYYDGSCAKDKWMYTDAWYHFDKSGYANRGWEFIDGKWYLFGNDCRMRKGWCWVDNKCYYLKESGELVTNSYIQSKSTPNYYHWVNSEGVWIAKHDSWDVHKFNVIE